MLSLFLLPIDDAPINYSIKDSGIKAKISPRPAFYINLSEIYISISALI